MLLNSKKKRNFNSFVFYLCYYCCFPVVVAQYSLPPVEQCSCANMKVVAETSCKVQSCSNYRNPPKICNNLDMKRCDCSNSLRFNPCTGKCVQPRLCPSTSMLQKCVDEVTTNPKKLPCCH